MDESTLSLSTRVLWCALALLGVALSFHTLSRDNHDAESAEASAASSGSNHRERFPGPLSARYQNGEFRVGENDLERADGRAPTPFRRAFTNALLVAESPFAAGRGKPVQRIRLWEVPGDCYRFYRTVETRVRGPDRELLSEEVMLADRILVDLKTIDDSERVSAWLEDLGLSKERAYGFSPVLQYRLPTASLEALPAWLARLSESEEGRVRILEDRVYFPTVTPNDPELDQQWALTLVGAEAAWEFSTGSVATVVAVIDSGFFLEAGSFALHSDFAYAEGNNVFQNPGEVAGDSIDNDGNGLIDDVSGWDFHSNDNIPEDAQGHGVSVAGIIGSAADNNFGIAGTAWRVSLLPLRAGSPVFPESVLVQCLDYLVDLRSRGIKVVVSNNSYGGQVLDMDVDERTPLFEAIERNRDAGILFVAGAGNSARNSDGTDGSGQSQHFFPSDFSLENILSVAATTTLDLLQSGSNFGAVSVDLGAPGKSIRSLSRSGAFRTVTGTSFAAPFVAGTAALLCTLRPEFDYAQIREIIVETGMAIPALEGKTVSGRRLDMASALELASRLDQPHKFWQWQHWGSNFDSIADSALDVDPDRDGLENIVEYLLLSDPESGNPEIGEGIVAPIPMLSASPPEGELPGTYLIVEFDRNLRASDVTFQFESFTGLFSDPWLSRSPDITQPLSLVPDRGAIRERYWFLLGATSSELLVRLRVSSL